MLNLCMLWGHQSIQMLHSSSTELLSSFSGVFEATHDYCEYKIYFWLLDLLSELALRLITTC